MRDPGWMTTPPISSGSSGSFSGSMATYLSPGEPSAGARPSGPPAPQREQDRARPGHPAAGDPGRGASAALARPVDDAGVALLGPRPAGGPVPAGVRAVAVLVDAVARDLVGVGVHLRVGVVAVPAGGDLAL